MGWVVGIYSSTDLNPNDSSANQNDRQLTEIEMIRCVVALVFSLVIRAQLSRGRSFPGGPSRGKKSSPTARSNKCALNEVWNVCGLR